MATYSIVGPNYKNIYSRTGPADSGSPLYEESGSKGSIKRTRPRNLMESLTGHSASSTKVEYKPGVPVTPNPITIGMNYAMTMSAQQLGCGAVSANLLTAAQKQSVRDELELRIRAKIQNVGWNAATSVAEMGETVRFLTTSVKELYDYYRLARKGDLLRLSELYRNRDQRGKRVPKWPARVTNRYLAWRFAVRPLVQDMDDALHHFHRSDLKPVIRTARARGSAHLSTYTTDLYQGNPDMIRQMIRDEKWQATRCVYFKVQPDVAAWKSLGLTNLAAVLWEVTPYSFMVDRVLPVGRFISSLDAMAGVTVIGDYLSEKRSAYGIAACRGASSKTTTETYSRSVYLGVGYPFPNFKPSVDVGYFVDSLALLAQLKTRGPVRGF